MKKGTKRTFRCRDGFTWEYSCGWHCRTLPNGEASTSHPYRGNIDGWDFLSQPLTIAQFHAETGHYPEDLGA